MIERYAFIVNNGTWFVIGFTEECVISISYYNENPTWVKQCQSLMEVQQNTLKIKDADPPDHDDIHGEMGKAMNLDPKQTMDGKRHFHWVCSIDDAGLQFLLGILMARDWKWISQKRCGEIIMYIQARQAAMKNKKK